jgi:2-polyprenyl-3-methyl-5-hydroxy-6-metoxy-1,4-benzoquinol methylase
VLEIGVRNGFVSGDIRKRRIGIITLDIDKRMNPNIAGSVLGLPFANGSFDLIACYEVLEHLPCKDFDKTLSKIFRYCCFL